VFDALARAEWATDSLADLDADLQKLRDEAEQEQQRLEAERSKRPKCHGRRDFVLEPQEGLLPGGGSLIKMGEEVSEDFDYRRSSVVRARTV
jgi:hypothetical protein